MAKAPKQNAVAAGLAAKSMAIDGLITDFYVAEALLIKTQTANVSIEKKREVLLANIMGAQRSVMNSLFYCLRDYFFFASMGEARHSHHACSGSLKIKGLPEGGSRTTIYAMAHEYDPIATLPELIKLFSKPWPGGSYGGKAWKGIASLSLQMFKSAPDKVLTDMAIDICHNNGSALNKTGLWTFAKGYDYMVHFLNHKRYNDVISDPFNYGYYLSFGSSRLCDYFQNVTHIKVVPTLHVREYFMQYVPDTVKYGTKIGTLIGPDVPDDVPKAAKAPKMAPSYSCAVQSYGRKR